MDNRENCTAAASTAQLLCPQNVTDLFDSVDAFLFDCDGIIWKGDMLIDGLPETLEILRSKSYRSIRSLKRTHVTAGLLSLTRHFPSDGYGVNVSNVSGGTRKKVNIGESSASVGFTESSSAMKSGGKKSR